MDRGKILTAEFTVYPGEEGSFIILIGERYNHQPSKKWGFTDIDDMLMFLNAEAEFFKQAKFTGKGGDDA